MKAETFFTAGIVLAPAMRKLHAAVDSWQIPDPS